MLKTKRSHVEDQKIPRTPPSYPRPRRGKKKKREEGKNENKRKRGAKQWLRTSWMQPALSLKFRDNTELSFRGSSRNEYSRPGYHDLFSTSLTSDGLGLGPGHTHLSWETASWF